MCSTALGVCRYGRVINGRGGCRTGGYGEENNEEDANPFSRRVAIERPVCLDVSYADWNYKVRPYAHVDDAS